MRCYKFFNWHYPADNKFKFLRKDEYQRMSVYHYSLENIRRDSELGSDNRYGFPIREIVPHMPSEIRTLLKRSADLDELLLNTCNTTIDLLIRWKTDIRKMNDNSLSDVLSKLGISKMKDENLKFNKEIPFDIHPILPIKVYYADQTDLALFSLSQKIRKNPLMTAPLHTSHYAFHRYLAGFVPEPESKKISKKLTGSMDDVLAKDALIWYMAKQYLDKLNPAIKDIVKSQIIKGADLKVRNLRQTEIPMKLNIPGTGKVFIGLKFHQLDDYLLIESKPVIARAVAQLLLRFDTTEKKAEVGVVFAKEGYRIPYDEIYKEIQRVFTQSVYWSFFILNWEKGILEKIGEREKTEFGKKNTGGSGFEHIKFRDVCGLAGLNNSLGTKLVKLRNSAFHAEIPEGWSYQQLEEDDEICRILNFTKKVKKDYTQTQ